MKTLRMSATIRRDGNLVVPVGIEEAGTKVEVTVAPAEDIFYSNGFTREEWFSRFDRVSGSIDDETFRRHADRIAEPPPSFEGGN